MTQFAIDEITMHEGNASAWIDVITRELLPQVAQERLAAYKRPKEIKRMDELPHNASGKVERLLLATGVKP